MVDIKRTIKTNGLSLNEVADILGMSRQGLYFHIQQGDKVSVDILNKIADILGCPVTDFFYMDNPTGVKCPHCGKTIYISTGADKQE